MRAESRRAPLYLAVPLQCTPLSFLLEFIGRARREGKALITKSMQAERGASAPHHLRYPLSNHLDNLFTS